MRRHVGHQLFKLFAGAIEIVVHELLPALIVSLDAGAQRHEHLARLPTVVGGVVVVLICEPQLDADRFHDINERRAFMLHNDFLQCRDVCYCHSSHSNDFFGNDDLDDAVTGDVT